MKVTLTPKEIAHVLYGASDIEFAEIFAYYNKMENGALLNKDEDEALSNLNIDKEDMQNLSDNILAVCKKLGDALSEIIDSPEIDSHAWWKETSV